MHSIDLALHQMKRWETSENLSNNLDKAHLECQKKPVSLMRLWDKPIKRRQKNIKFHWNS